MTDPNRIDREFRRQAKKLKPAPIHWDQIERRARRRRRLMFLFLLGLTLVLTIGLAAVLLAGKTAIDPTYSPPIFSRSTITGEIVSPPQGHELESTLAGGSIPPAMLMKRLGHPGLGYPVEASLDVRGLANQRIHPVWVWRKVGGNSSSRGRTTIETPVSIDSNSESLRLSTVLRDPPVSGRYAVELRLSSRSSVVGRLTSKAFYAIGSKCCQLYTTPTYSAWIPIGWKLEEDFMPVPEHRHVSELVRTPRMTIVIDTTSHEHGDPRNDQRVLENLLKQGTERYSRVALKRFSVDRGPVEEWSYWSGHDIYTNELFYRGHNGFAILGRSLRDHFREMRDLCRIIVASLRSK